MNMAEIKEKSKTMLAQVIIRIAIFLLFIDYFLTGIFSVRAAFYLIILLIIANIVFIFINKTRGIFTNIILFLLAISLSTFLIGTVSSILGAIISFFHALKFSIRYFKGEKEEEKGKSKKERKYQELLSKLKKVKEEREEEKKAKKKK